MPVMQPARRPDRRRHRPHRQAIDTTGRDHMTERTITTRQKTTSPRGRYAHRLTTAQRFWGRVIKNPGDGCWVWKGAGATNRTSYGRFQPELGNRHLTPAHRWAYEQLNGPIPDGLQLDHLCRNRHCVRPSHLEPVTCKVNLLRGETFNARNASKTHCPAGHPYSDANLRIWNGRRVCRACDSIKQARHRARTKESQNV